MDRQQHWNGVYTTKTERDVSWFELSPDVSIQMIEAAGLATDACVVDVGGGESRLVDALLAHGVSCIAVLDVAHAALDRARARLGPKASCVHWIQADVVSEWSWKPADIWHDRGVFHFLIEREDRQQYCARLAASVKPGGSAVIATFALDGPDKCSGLPVTRYSPETLSAELGDRFTLVESRPYAHVTPWGAVQAFQYSRFRKR